MQNKTELLSFVLSKFLEHSNFIKMCHFQIKQYSVHKETDKYWETFNKNYDEFMEVAQGKFGFVNHCKLNLEVSKPLTKEDLFVSLQKFEAFLNTFDRVFGKQTDLLTIRDTMLSRVSQLKYILRFD